MKSLHKIPFISILITGWDLATEGYSDCTPKYRRKQQLKAIYHTLLNLRFADEWFEFIKSPDFSQVSQHRPRLYIKPFRPYMSIKWNKKRRANIIIDTYKFIENKKTIFGQFLTQSSGIVIAKLKLENNYDGIIQLGYEYAFRKEGELALSLVCEQLGGRITSVVFSFEEITKGEWICLIGCIQGHKNKNFPDAFKLMQKSIFGLRPNSLIIYSAQELLRNIGITAIYGIGNSIHVSNRKHAINFPWEHNITFDYDRFWHEIGGENINKDWFAIPLNPVRKNIQEISSHKRSMYLKRYKMLDDLSLQILKLLNS